MDFKQLVYFHTVAKVGNITRAAELLHVAQPSLSKTISRLEEDVGAQLFERTPNAIRLNENGHAFLQHAERILREAQDARNELTGLSSGESGHVYFAATVPELLGDAVRAYITAHPNVVVHQLQASTKQIESMLLEGEIDFAFSGAPIFDARIQWKQVTVEQIGLVVSRENPLSRIPVHRIEDLKTYPLVLNSNVDQQAFLQSVFENGSAGRNIVYEGSQADVIGYLVSENRGVAFSSRRRFESLKSMRDFAGETDKIVFCRIDPPPYLLVGSGVLRGRYLSPAARRCFQYITEYINGESGEFFR